MTPLLVTHFIPYSRAYWGFADHFKEQADQLLNSLEVNHRRMLQANGGGNLSNSSSSNSVNLAGRATTMAPTQPRSRQASVTSTTASQENLAERKNTLTRKLSGIPVFNSPLNSGEISLCCSLSANEIRGTKQRDIQRIPP